MAGLGSLLRAEVDDRLSKSSEAIDARDDINKFASYCFVADDGKHFVQAPHHILLHKVHGESDRQIVWFPVEHGKTQQAKVLILHEMGKHPDRQYAYISSKQDQANKFVASVGREIVKNPRIKDVFPHLKPQQSATSRAYEQWGDTQIRIQGAPPGAKDSSLAAFGIDGQILGSRLHGAILDNILDRANAQTKTRREKILEIIETEVLSRILPGGWVLIIDTAWHIDDALHQLSRRDGWDSVKLDAEVGIVEGDESLWASRFPQDRLEKIRGQMGQVAYDRTYRNKPLSASMDLFKAEWLHRCMSHNYEFVDRYSGKGVVSTGVDLAVKAGTENDLTVFFTICLDELGRYRVLNILAKKMEAPAIMSTMIDIYRRFHKHAGSGRFTVEDNAAQKYILQTMQDKAMFNARGGSDAEWRHIQLKGYTTTSKKRDEEYGIPSIAVDFEMGRWAVPEHPECKSWYDEMFRWSPDAHTGDRLMASWFAREGLRMPKPGVIIL
jgi:hypothetical protein